MTLTTTTQVEAAIAAVLIATEDAFIIHDDKHFEYQIGYTDNGQIAVSLSYCIGYKECEPYNYNSIPSAPELIFEHQILYVRIGERMRKFVNDLMCELEIIANKEIKEFI